MSCKETLFGIVPEEWTVTAIAEVIELRQGLQISKKLRSDVKGEGYIPLLKITDLPNRIFSEYVTGVAEGYIADENDIIYTRTGQVGLVYTGVTGCVHNNCFKVIPNEEVLDKGYVYYYLKSNRMLQNSNNIASGSVQKDLTHKAFKTVKIGYPSLNKQKKIASILSSIDKKIELNNEMNKTLEEMAQALFKKWVIDFEFPNEDGEPYKYSGGEMIESELGMIPKGWSIKTFEESDIEIEDGDRGKNYPKKNELLKQGFCPFLSNKNMVEDKINLIDTDYITMEKDNVLRKGKVFIDDIVLTTRGTVGNIGLFNEELGYNHARINSGMVIIRGGNKVNTMYLYELLKSKAMKDNYKNMATGTAQPQLPIRDIKKINILVPDKEVQDKIGQVLRGIYKKVFGNCQQINNLNKLRDSLLPKLMSGEIRVEDIEASL